MGPAQSTSLPAREGAWHGVGSGRDGALEGQEGDREEAMSDVLCHDREEPGVPAHDL